MSAYSCCGGYNEHERDCWGEKMKEEVQDWKRRYEWAVSERDTARAELAAVTRERDELRKLAGEHEQARAEMFGEATTAIMERDAARNALEVYKQEAKEHMAELSAEVERLKNLGIDPEEWRLIQSEVGELKRENARLKGALIKTPDERNVLRAEVERLRGALEFYANENNYGHYETASCECCSDWVGSDVEDEKGERARKALEGKPLQTCHDSQAKLERIGALIDPNYSGGDVEWLVSNYIANQEQRIQQLSDIVAEVQRYREALQRMANQTLSDEYEEQEGEELDVDTMAEAYELLVLEARQALLKLSRQVSAQGGKDD